MTYTMYDAVDTAALPGSAYAYAGYTDGLYQTYGTLLAQHPGAHILSITVSASSAARCLDVESGDAVNSQVAAWVRDKALSPPVVYTSASNVQSVVSALTGAGYARSQYLIWSAHYTGSKHICAPSVCGYPAADGTQWSSAAYDTSEISAAFFPAAPAFPATTEIDMQIPPATKPASATGVSFDGTPYKTVGFLADPSYFAEADEVKVRIAFHRSGSWSVQDITLTKAAPKVVADVPAGSDGASFVRLDTVPITLVPNFA